MVLAEFTAVVTERKNETDSVICLTLRGKDSPLPGWEPGAHVDIVLPDGDARQYSLSGWEVGGHEWTLGILVEDEGRGGSRWLAEHAVVGAEIGVSTPRNHFRYEREVDSKKIFIAGGIGITPLIPMMVCADSDGQDWELHYVGSAIEQMAFRDELELNSGRVRLYPRDSGPRPDLEQIFAATKTADIYCCGPEGLMESVEELARQFSHVTAHVERFNPRPIGDERGAEEFEVYFDYSQLTGHVGPEETILQVAEDLGIDVPTSCREGTCGTCETPIMDGQVVHLDSILSDAEREASQTMMICISRANCSRLVLDM